MQAMREYLDEKAHSMFLHPEEKMIVHLRNMQSTKSPFYHETGKKI